MKKYVICIQLGVGEEWDSYTTSGKGIKELLETNKYADFITGLVIYEQVGSELKVVTIEDVKNDYDGLWFDD